MIVHLVLALSLAPPRDGWIGRDKLKHFFVSAFTQSVAYSALEAARVGHRDALIGAWVATGVVSVGKEIHDRRSYGLFSVRDLAWDAAGAAAATILIERSVRSSSSGATTAISARDPSGASLLSGVRHSPILPERVSDRTAAPVVSGPWGETVFHVIE
jgi:uncharacterized protein YfiM (DUF2279 family)